MWRASRRVDTGERLFVWCDGGPAALSGSPVPASAPQIEVDGGIYVLVDDGPPEHWRYEFVRGLLAPALDRRVR